MTETGQMGQYLTFQVAGEEYAVGILRVKEIIRYDTLTKVPSTPPWILGVLNLRGSVVPVVDLALKFGLEPSPITPRSCVVIIEVDLGDEETLMGVVADAVKQVLDLAASDIEPAPPFGTRVRVEYLRGMGRVGKKFVLILDSDRVLATHELLAALHSEPAPAGTAEPERAG